MIPQPAAADKANVSRETSPPRRRYVSAFRAHKGELTRQPLIDAVVSFAEEGTFRPEASDIARIAKVSPATITHHFGTLRGLYCAVARARPEAIAAAAQRQTVPLAWLVMVRVPMGGAQ